MTPYTVDTTPPAEDGTCMVRLILPTGDTTPWSGPVPGWAVEQFRQQADMMSAAFSFGVYIGGTQPRRRRSPGDFTLTPAQVARGSRRAMRVGVWVASAVCGAAAVTVRGLADLYRDGWHGPAVWALWIAVATDAVVLAFAAVHHLAAAASLAEVERRGEVWP